MLRIAFKHLSDARWHKRAPPEERGRTREGSRFRKDAIVCSPAVARERIAPSPRPGRPAAFLHLARKTITLGMLLFLCAVPARTEAQTQRPELTEYQVKALFLLNFTRYVEWPDEAFATDDSPFVIGIAGQDPFDENLLRLVRDRVVNGRPIEVRNVDGPAEIRACHLLFIGLSERTRIEEILGHTGNRHMLTVGETPGFLERGGGINFMMRDDHVRFEINLHATRESNLRVRSQLLRVAEAVKNK